MDTSENIAIPAKVYFDSIIYFYLLALSVHEGEDVIVLDPQEFIRATEPEAEERSARLNVSFFKDMKNAQKRFQFELANSMMEMIAMWVDHLSLDVNHFKEFNRYAYEKYGLNLPIEFRGKRPALTLVLNRQ